MANTACAGISPYWIDRDTWRKCVTHWSPRRLGVAEDSILLVTLSDFVMCEPSGSRKGSKHRFQGPSLLRLNSLFRSNAVVIYDNPSEKTT